MCLQSARGGFPKAWNSVCKTRDSCDRALQGLFGLTFTTFQHILACVWAEYIDVDVLSFSIPFAGMKNVAFFFNAISTQSLKKPTGKKKANEEDEESDDNEQFPDSSQVASSTSQEWVSSHPTIFPLTR